jgi:hypothetical protein
MLSFPSRLPNRNHTRIIPTLDRHLLIDRFISIANDIQRRANAGINIHTHPNRKVGNAGLQTNLTAVAGEINQAKVYRTANRRDAGSGIGRPRGRTGARKGSNHKKSKSKHRSSPELDLRETLCHGSENLIVSS